VCKRNGIYRNTLRNTSYYSDHDSAPLTLILPLRRGGGLVGIRGCLSRHARLTPTASLVIKVATRSYHCYARYYHSHGLLLPPLTVCSCSASATGRSLCAGANTPGTSSLSHSSLLLSSLSPSALPPPTARRRSERAEHEHEPHQRFGLARLRVGAKLPDGELIQCSLFGRGPCGSCGGRTPRARREISRSERTRQCVASF